MRHASAVLLLLACFAPAALAQSPPDVAAPSQDVAAVHAARAMTCAQYLKEVSEHRATRGEPVQTPSFALVWGALLESDPKSSGHMGKRVLGRLLYDNTLNSCLRMRARSLGS